MVKEIHLFDKVYRNALTLFLADDPAEVDKFLDDIGFKGDRIIHKNHQAAYYRIRLDENEAGNDGSMLWMKVKDIPCLVHELSHFIFQEFTEKAVPLTLENDEAFAYYLEFWTNEVMEAWVDWKPKSLTKVNDMLLKAKKPSNGYKEAQ